MRLVYLGNLVVDLVLEVSALPDRGADLLAGGARSTAGGGFNVLAAAARQGLPGAYGGAHGTGPFGDLARAALAAEGIDVLQPPARDRDTGVVVVMVDAEGERTFVTASGAEASPPAGALAAIRSESADIIGLSGYTLAHPASRADLLAWLGARTGVSLAQEPDELPPASPGRPGTAGGPGPEPAPRLVVFDPGPLAGQLPAGALAEVLRRTDWLTCNAREAGLLCGEASPEAAARSLAERLPPGGGVIVRDGPAGCYLSHDGELHTIPGFAVRAVDTTGAGDTHTGVFIAALARGAAPPEAARLANAAAAISVTRRGPATAPDAAELSAFLADPATG